MRRIELGEGSDGKAGREGEAVDEPISQLARHVRRLTVDDRHLKAERFEHEREVGAGRAGARTDAHPLAVELGDAFDA